MLRYIYAITSLFAARCMLALILLDVALPLCFAALISATLID